MSVKTDLEAAEGPGQTSSADHSVLRSRAIELQPPTTDHPAVRLLSRWWELAGVVAAAAALTGAFLYFNPLSLARPPEDVRRASAALEHEVRQAKAVGLPLTAKELPWTWEIPTSQNAAPGLTKAADDLWDARVNIEVERRFWREDWKGAEKILDGAAEPLRRAEQALALPLFRPSAKTLDYGMGSPENDSKGAFEVGRALIYRGFLSARKGDTGEAGRNYGAALRMAGMMRRAGGLSPYVYGRRVEKLTMESMAKAALFTGDPGVIAQVSANAEPIDHRQMLDEATVTLCATFRNLASLESAGWTVFEISERIGKRDPHPMIVSDGLPNKTLHRAAMSRLIHASLAYARILRQGPVSQKMIGDLLEADKRLWDSKDQSVAFWHDDAPRMGDFTASLLAEDARRELRRASLLLLKHRLTFGSYPKSLSEAGITATDPYTGRPIGYRKKGGSFLVWSAGEDWVDNGGQGGSDFIMTDRSLGRTSSSF